MSRGVPVKGCGWGGRKRKSVDDYAEEYQVDFISRSINRDGQKVRVLVCRFCCQSIGARSDRIKEHLMTKRHQKLKLDALHKNTQTFGEDLTQEIASAIRVLPEPTTGRGRNQLRESVSVTENRKFSMATPQPLSSSSTYSSGCGISVYRTEGGSGNKNGGADGSNGSSSSTEGSVTSAASSPKTSSLQQLMRVKWNTFNSNMDSMFSKFLTQEHFVDVTLWCEGETVKCHKMILAACSSYFEKIFIENPTPHPIIFLRDTRLCDIQALVEFMYRGEVSVNQSELPNLLKAAVSLQIKGLGSPPTVNESDEAGNEGAQRDTINSSIPTTNNSLHHIVDNKMDNDTSRNTHAHIPGGDVSAGANCSPNSINDFGNDSYLSFPLMNRFAGASETEKEILKSARCDHIVKRRKTETAGHKDFSTTPTTGRSPSTFNLTVGSEVEEDYDDVSESDAIMITYEREEFYKMQGDKDKESLHPLDPLSNRVTKAYMPRTMSPQITPYPNPRYSNNLHVGSIKREIPMPDSDDFPVTLQNIKREIT